MTNRFNIPAPADDETPDERHTRHLAEYDHCHDTSIFHALINVAPVQSVGDETCTECGRTIIIRADSSKGVGWASNAPNGTAELWQHTYQCSLYEPHPDSIAGQPGYAPPAAG